MQDFLGGPGERLRSTVQAVAYAELWRRPTLPAGTYLFTDLDRLGEGQRPAVTAVRNALVAAGADHAVLNDPTAMVLRHDLLELLHGQGANRFRSYRGDEVPDGARYPVFVRHEAEHSGSYTPLLGGPEALRRWLPRTRLRCRLLGLDPAGLLVVEHLDTADAQGVYRKYSAFRVGGRVVPRHVLFSRSWMVKKPDLLDADLLAEERRYIAGNPHEPWLDTVFRLAGVDYGRIDYSVHAGEPQVWEINSNPVVVPAGALGPDDVRADVHRRFVAALEDCLRALDRVREPAAAVPNPVRGAAPATRR